LKLELSSLDRERGTKINRIVSRALSFLPIPLGRFVGVRVGVANFLSQSIDIDETNKFQLQFFCAHHSFGRSVGVAHSERKCKNIFRIKTSA